MTMHEIKALIDAMAASDLAEMEVAKDGWTLWLSRRARSAAETPPRVAPATSSPEGSRPEGSRPEEFRPEDRRTGSAEAASPVPAPAPTAAGEVRAPLAGLVYLAPSAEAPPFVAVGQAVEAGALLGTVEAMKTFHEVRSPRAGVVAAILVASGDEVEGGQPLFRLR